MHRSWASVYPTLILVTPLCAGAIAATASNTCSRRAVEPMNRVAGSTSGAQKGGGIDQDGPGPQALNQQPNGCAL